jgi:hypothetical protein
VDDDLVAAFPGMEPAGQVGLGHGDQGVGLGGSPSVGGFLAFTLRVVTVGARGVRGLG